LPGAIWVLSYFTRPLCSGTPPRRGCMHRGRWRAKVFLGCVLGPGFASIRSASGAHRTSAASFSHRSMVWAARMMKESSSGCRKWPGGAIVFRSVADSVPRRRGRSKARMCPSMAVPKCPWSAWGCGRCPRTRSELRHLDPASHAVSSMLLLTLERLCSAPTWFSAPFRRAIVSCVGLVECWSVDRLRCVRDLRFPPACDLLCMRVRCAPCPACACVWVKPELVMAHAVYVLLLRTS